MYRKADPKKKKSRLLSRPKNNLYLKNAVSGTGGIFGYKFSLKMRQKMTVSYQYASDRPTDYPGTDFDDEFFLLRCRPETISQSLTTM